MAKLYNPAEQVNIALANFNGTTWTVDVEVEWEFLVDGTPVAGATPAAAIYINAIRSVFGITSFGVVSVRYIAGTTTMSQHSWGNAVDVMCEGELHRQVAYFTDANRGPLSIAHLLADPYFPSPRGDHYNHVHADFNPQYPI